MKNYRLSSLIAELPDNPKLTLPSASSWALLPVLCAASTCSSSSFNKSVLNMYNSVKIEQEID